MAQKRKEQEAKKYTVTEGKNGRLFVTPKLHQFYVSQDTTGYAIIDAKPNSSHFFPPSDENFYRAEDREYAASLARN